MKRTSPTKIPRFKSDEEIVVFMEKHGAFDLLDTDLADIVTVAALSDEGEREKTLSRDRVGEKNKSKVEQSRRSK